MKIILLMDMDRKRIEEGKGYSLVCCSVCGKPHMGHKDVIASMSVYDKAVCAECEAERIIAKGKKWSEKFRYRM